MDTYSPSIIDFALTFQRTAYRSCSSRSISSSKCLR